MATTKNALIRYKILDNCFRNTGKQYFIEDLIDECNNVLSEIDPDSDGISLRTIRGDIAFMKSSEGWSIELGDFKEGKKMYYRYIDPKFSINNMPLNEIEVNQLQSALGILTQFKGMPQFKWISELIPKLRQGIEGPKMQNIVMEFGNNEFLKGYEFIGNAYNAIIYKKVLQIIYRPFNHSEDMVIIFHPYYLKQYNNRWFFFGYNQEIKKFNWNLALDRIVGIKEVNLKFKENNEIIWNEYFDDIIGVTKPEGAEIEKIILHFLGSSGKYIESKPIHGSQISKWIDEQTLEVKLSLIINYEFERVLLSYADSVKIIAPLSLKDSLLEKLKKALELNQV